MAGDIPAPVAAPRGEDDDLLTRARAGDADAMEALLVRYQPRLYRFGLRMCRNPDDAGDVAQESLIAMARALPGFRGDSSVSTWLYTIARRLCVRRRRRTASSRADSIDGSEREAAHAVADPRPGPEHAAAGRELEAGLVAAIDALEPGQREVLLLRDVEGLPAAEVAAVLGISVDAVKSRLHRARTAVRRRLARLIEGLPVEGPRGPSCPDVPTLFSQYLEGEIDPAACARMEAHLAGCARCQGACDALKRTLAACRRLPVPEVPPETVARVRSAIRALLAGR
jgi:RNA polymerase sigma-70 factor (ECF subfamily)